MPVDELAQSKGVAGCDTAAAVDDIVDPLIGNVDRVGQFTLGQTHRIEECLQ